MATTFSWIRKPSTGLVVKPCQHIPGDHLPSFTVRSMIKHISHHKHKLFILVSSLSDNKVDKIANDNIIC